jgi:hypothetical protein
MRAVYDYHNILSSGETYYNKDAAGGSHVFTPSTLVKNNNNNNNNNNDKKITETLWKRETTEDGELTRKNVFTLI